jgi:nicotinate-nucleotide adenylyltransferase
MVVAVYGGAFNPPHVGHAMVASWILWTGRADQVVLVPSSDHPFGKPMASFDLRLRLCAALSEELGRGVGWSDIERGLPRPSHTINLLRAIREKSPHDRVRFVMGVDNLLLREKWFGFDDIEREFDPIFVDRAGIVHDLTLDSPKFPDVSSTEIRKRIVEGLPINHLVTKGVLDVLRPQEGQ